MKRFAVLIVLLSLAGCHEVRRAPASSSSAPAASPAPQGVFDNHAQVWQAHETAPGAVPPPHVSVVIEATDQADWTIWQVRLDTNPAIEALWAMHAVALDAERKQRGLRTDARRDRGARGRVGAERRTALRTRGRAQRAGV